jgi:CHAD domain-containing protein
MSYELRADETLGDGIQRIVCHQIEGAVRASTARQNGRGSPVHATRKHLKKARAALRLVRGGLDRDIWKREDRRLGKVGRLISEVRDAEVRLETVRQLRKFAGGRGRRFLETEELLTFELDSFLAAFSEWPHEAGEQLTQTLDRIGAWPLGDLSCKRLRKNVQRTYQRGRKGLKIAIRKTSTKNLHTFRKRAKTMRYQLRLLRPLAPAVFKELNDELKTIGQYLGEVHDLAFVAERLSSIGKRKQGDRVLNGLLEARATELERTAIALGERFYAERPRQFASRISQYFSEWETLKQRCLTPNGRSVLLLN